MKTKISITLSVDLLSRIDREVGSVGSRSAFIEKVLRYQADIFSIPENQVNAQ